METALRRIADMLEAFIDAFAAWFATGAWRPEAWPGITWVLVAAFFVLSWLLAWRRRAPRGLDVRPPQLLVTSGEVVPDGTDEPELRSSGRRRRRPTPQAHAAAGAYTMTVSNLSRYPVQLLEVALRDGRRGAPRVATVDAVVPAMGSVSVSGRISLGLRGDGWLDVYCYAAAPRVKVHRHRVELVWEPWAARFKAAPLEQVSAPARRLASDEPDARFLEDDVPEPAEPVAVAVPIPARAAERRDAPRPSSARSTPIDEGSTWAPTPPAAAVPKPVVREPTAPAVPVPEPAVPEPAVPEPAVPEPMPPAVPAPEPAVRAGVAPPRSEAADPNPRSAARPPASAEARPPGVPRIATPPVGVAVTGRGGASARTADGLPIGRPTARPERGPTAEGEPVRDALPAAAPEPEPEPDRAREAVRRTPVPATPAPPAAPTNAASEDEPPSEPSVRRRPRLEFPDEF